MRAALQCVARAEVFASGATPGIVNTLTIVGTGNAPANQLLVRRADRSPYLYLEVAIDFTVAFLPDESTWHAYQAVVTTYLYAVNDLSGRELFAYHWHPQGMSHVKTPHLHISGTDSIQLPGRPGNPELTRLSLSRAHFPTRAVELAELLRFLIRDLEAQPRKQDWAQVLDAR